MGGRQARRSPLRAAGRAGAPLLPSLPLQGNYYSFMETKEETERICSHLFLPCLGVFSHYREIPRWGDDLSPSFSHKKCVCRIIPSQLVKSMTQLSLDEKVTQNLIAFHIASPPRKHNCLVEMVREVEAWWCFTATFILAASPQGHSCCRQLRHHESPVSFLGKKQVWARLAP